jgi:ATP-dependent RNA circularization protein (DNA/RNA ligase family)
MAIGSYSSIYNLGHRALGELFDGPVVIEEKVDGSQFSFAKLDGEFHCRSKGQEMHPDAPEKMFSRAVEVTRGLDLPEGIVFRAEYLQKPKHNSLAYSRIPTNHLVVFDIHEAGEGAVLPPEAKREMAARFGLECVPCIHEGPFEYDFDKIKAFLERESFLGGQKIEGVVIKNYAKFSPDKKTLMGKYVSEAFKETNKLNWKVTNPTSGDVLFNLIERYRTENRWRKAIQHLRELGTLEDTPRDIPKVLLEVQADVEKECADEIRELLWAHFWPKVRRSIVGGLPEFYKETLARGQATENDE